MGRVFGVAAAALFVCGTAAAQQSTDTTCSRYGDQVYCNSTTRGGNPYQDAYDRAARRGQTQDDALGAMLRARREREERAKRDELRRTVGERVKAGRCDSARSIALENGDLELAALVQQVCKPPS
jgi:hypothetical protein